MPDGSKHSIDRKKIDLKRGAIPSLALNNSSPVVQIMPNTEPETEPIPMETDDSGNYTIEDVVAYLSTITTLRYFKWSRCEEGVDLVKMRDDNRIICIFKIYLDLTVKVC